MKVRDLIVMLVSDYSLDDEIEISQGTQKPPIYVNIHGAPENKKSYPKEPEPPAMRRGF